MAEPARGDICCPCPQVEQLHGAEHLVPPHPQAQAPEEETEDEADRQGKAGTSSSQAAELAFLTREGMQDRSGPVEFTGKAPGWAQSLLLMFCGSQVKFSPLPFSSH